MNAGSVVVVRFPLLPAPGRFVAKRSHPLRPQPPPPIAAYVKQRCTESGCASVMAKRTMQPNTEHDRKRRA